MRGLSFWSLVVSSLILLVARMAGSGLWYSKTARGILRVLPPALFTMSF
jgi:hypothetical protein